MSQIGFCLTGSISLIFLKAVALVWLVSEMTYNVSMGTLNPTILIPSSVEVLLYSQLVLFTHLQLEDSRID